MSRHIGVSVMVLLLIAGVWGSALAQTEEELRAVHRASVEALNAHDVDQYVSYLTDDVVYDYVPMPAPMNGKEEVAAFLKAVMQAFPDWDHYQRRILVSGNIMVTECTVTGTQQGAWAGIPATGQSFQVIHMDILEFEGTQCKRMTTYDDAVSLMVQLGVMPASDLPPLKPSFTLPDPEPTGLSPLEANAEFVARINAQDSAAMAKIIRSDAELLVGPLGVPVNRDAYIAVHELYYFTAFSDLRLNTVRSIDMGDGWIASEFVITGTNDGPYFGIPATGRSLENRMGTIVHYNGDGLVTYLGSYLDNMTLMIQLGLIPPPEPSTVSPASWGEIKAKFR